MSRDKYGAFSFRIPDWTSSSLSHTKLIGDLCLLAGMTLTKTRARGFLPWNLVCVLSLANRWIVLIYLFLDGTIESNWTEVVEQFDQMNLREPLLRGIYGYGFERPSAIQQRAIKPCIMG